MIVTSQGNAGEQPVAADLRPPPSRRVKDLEKRATKRGASSSARSTVRGSPRIAAHDGRYPGRFVVAHLKRAPQHPRALRLLRWSQAARASIVGLVYLDTHPRKVDVEVPRDSDLAGKQERESPRATRALENWQERATQRGAFSPLPEEVTRALEHPRVQTRVSSRVVWSG